TIGEYCDALSIKRPKVSDENLESGEVILWRKEERPKKVRVAPSRSERRRHSRKYAEGVLPPDRSLYFRGPDDRLNLRAQNLILFVQMGEGVEEERWMHHLRHGDYSKWFLETIKDEGLADEAAGIEQRPDVSPAESRELIRQAVERRYTIPPAAPSEGAAPDQ